MALSNKRKYVNNQCYPVLFDWVISKETLLQNTSIISELFDVENLPGVKYSLHLDLKRVADSVEGTYVYLHLILPTDMIINAKFSIFCKSAGFVHNCSNKYKRDSPGWGSRLCLSNELFDPAKKFIIDDKLVIYLKATLDVEQRVPDPSKVQNGESLGWQLWNNEEDKDVTIKVNGMEIKAHKCVLKRRSPKFDSFFKVKSEPSTTKKNPGCKITVKKHTYDTVKEGIMFCYDIQSSEILSAEEATDLLKFAKEYQIMDLKKNMEEFCIENLSIFNACLFANTSVTVEAEKLYQKCFDFLLKCMKDGTAVKDVDELNEGMQKELFVQTFKKVCQS